MIREAKKRGLRKDIALKLIHYKIKWQFAGVHVKGNIHHLSGGDSPTLYIANHISVWDFPIACYLTYRHLHLDPFSMTAEYSMLPLAEFAGAFSVNVSDKWSNTQAIRYAANLIKDVRQCGLWMFPQGMILPHNVRPLNFQKGVDYLARIIGHLTIIPVAFYYSFANHSKPEAFVNFGNPIIVNYAKDKTQISPSLEQRIILLLDEMCENIAQDRTADFQTLIHGTMDLRLLWLKTVKKHFPPLKTWGRWY